MEWEKIFVNQPTTRTEFPRHKNSLHSSIKKFLKTTKNEQKT